MKFVKLDDLREWRENYIRSGKAKSYDDMTALLVFINSVVSIDIVRCRECWHSKKIECEDGVFEYLCDISDLKWRADDFCSYGERSSE